MNAARSQNLKKLLDAVPAGYLVDAAWLVSQGIACESFRDYMKRGWLDRITRGVFRRPLPYTQPHRRRTASTARPASFQRSTSWVMTFMSAAPRRSANRACPLATPRRKQTGGR
ncbi:MULTISPECIES: AbiEi antitoxin N-terminal domain-containing protein [Actibacterium]|uniref:AbiEi antitoxin N-terminal domain-containing protein n=1 Tax=Actibacterium TaxID=1433986 RepID=UPI001F3EC097|nr:MULTISPECIES: AbiEi antitoxin N-terminal domain-containing protein [Actibacterium]